MHRCCDTFWIATATKIQTKKFWYFVFGFLITVCCNDCTFFYRIHQRISRIFVTMNLRMFQVTEFAYSFLWTVKVNNSDEPEPSWRILSLSQLGSLPFHFSSELKIDQKTSWNFNSQLKTYFLLCSIIKQTN